MDLIKIEFTDADRKCYTNVSEHRFTEGFFVFTISNGSEELIKAFPSDRIKHIQIEQM